MTKEEGSLIKKTKGKISEFFLHLVTYGGFNYQDGEIFTFNNPYTFIPLIARIRPCLAHGDLKHSRSEPACAKGLGELPASFLVVREESRPQGAEGEHDLYDVSGLDDVLIISLGDGSYSHQKRDQQGA